MSAFLLLAALLANERLVFTKVFPQSDPPYVGITVEQTGAGEFRSTPNDDQPVAFQLSPEETAQLFGLAAKVDLGHPLEAGAHVANMGQKTIRYEKAGKGAEQTFNYSEDLNARAMADWFERISESEQCFLALERSAKYEKIGVNEAILNLQAAWERKRLVAPRQFLPLLDKVAKGESYMQMARTRAANLADTFRTLP